MPKLVGVVGIRRLFSTRYAEEFVLGSGVTREAHWSAGGSSANFVVTNVEGALSDLSRFDEGYETLLYASLSLILDECEQFRVGAHQITPRDPALQALQGEVSDLRSAVQVLEQQLRALRTESQLGATVTSGTALYVGPYRDPACDEAPARPIERLDHRVLSTPILIPPGHSGLQAHVNVLDTPALGGIRPVRWILSIGGIESRDVL